jgi:biopolymer transport protein TolR
MAQVDDSGSGRSANTDLNLVPFIDLMSVLITFLLITAVWTQVSMIQLGSSIYGKKNEQQDVTPPPPRADIPLRLDVKPFGFQLIVGTEKHRFPKTGGAYDMATLLAKLQQVKQTYPDKGDAVITVDDELAYEYLIQGMDTLNQAGFATISVATAAAAGD